MGSSYVYSGSGDGGGGDAVLKWNGSRPITDRNSYNQTFDEFDLWAGPGDQGMMGHRPFYVSDIALSVDIEMGEGAIVATPKIVARGHEFRAVVDAGAGTGVVEMRVDAEGEEWVGLDSGSFGKKSGGDVVGVEFWHVDQALWLFVDGELVCGGNEDGGYSMSPLERVVAATGMSREELESDVRVGNGVIRPGVLSRAEIYREPTVEWRFGGGDFVLHNVRVRRDISYMNMAKEPTRGGHPDFFPTLTDEEYFMCGDNSARSGDSRLWTQGSIMPWIEALIDDRAGMVHQDLIVGKAFVVYWPSLLKEGVVPAPDIGRVRWIW